MDINEVARRSGVPASALRYYEQKGLIASVGRSGLRRVFAASVLERLALIALGRSAGLSLDEIALMFANDGRLKVERKLLADKADELDKSIRQMIPMRDGKRLSSDLFRPEAEGRFPVIIMYHPYRKDDVGRGGVGDPQAHSDR